MEIPKVLCDPAYRFIRLNKYALGDEKSKEPLKGIPWKKNLLKFNDPILLNWINDGGNVGWVAGHGNIRFIDIDKSGKEAGLDKELHKKLHTLILLTGSGNYHFVIKTDYDQNHDLKDGMGEFRAKGEYVVCAPSRHPDTGKRYKIHSNVPVAEFDAEMVDEILKPIRIGARKGEQVEVEYTGTMRVIPDSVDKLIQEGVHKDKEKRNKWAWVITKQLYKRGYKKEEILVMLLDYNKNCTPSKSKAEMERHLDWLWNNKQSLADKVNKAWHDKFVKEGYGTEGMRKLVLIGADELAEMDIPKTEWLVEGLIPKAKLGMIAGRKGNYKSFFALRLALSIASGTDFYGRKVKKSKVIYFDEEIGDEEFKQRIKMVSEGMGINRKQKNLKCFFTRRNENAAPQLDTKEGKAQVLEAIEREKPDLVIFDLMRRFHGVQENKADDVQAFYKDVLKPMFEGCGISIIGIFHNRKAGKEFRSYTPYNVDIYDMMEEVRSSSEWVNVTSFFISPKRFNSRSLFCGLYSYVRNHSAKEAFFRVEFQKDRVFFTETSQEEIERTELVADNERVKTVVMWMEEGTIKDFKTKDIKDLFNNKLKNNQIQRVLDAMIDSGIIKKEAGRGSYKKIEVEVKTLDDDFADFKG